MWSAPRMLSLLSLCILTPTSSLQHPVWDGGGNKELKGEAGRDSGHGFRGKE